MGSTPRSFRWGIRRKAAVVAEVQSGALTLDDACRKYDLTAEELLSWQRLVEKHGVPGLRTTRLQHYRKRDPERPAVKLRPAWT